MKIVGVYYALILEFIVDDWRKGGGKSNKNLTWVTGIQVKVTPYYYAVNILKYFSKKFSYGIIQRGYTSLPILAYCPLLDIVRTSEYPLLFLDT